MRHGGKILTDHLVAQGVERVFSVPGESFLAALDGLYDSGIQNVVCRHEGAAAMMAEAHGKLTGRPGVAFVTRGPGACNASSGVHVARQDSTPMILFVGQIARGHRDREAFQEVDYRAMFAPLAKWVAEVDQTERLPEYLNRAFHVAMSGRPGPVVLALPEDMLSAEADVRDPTMPATIAKPDMRGAASRIGALMADARRPMVVVGGPHWSDEAAGHLAQFAENNDLPVVSSFRRQHYLDNRHENYAGDLNVGINPRLAKRMAKADCLLILGTRFSDIETQGYTNPTPEDGKRIIHVHADPDEIGRVYRPELGAVATAPEMLAALVKLPAQRMSEPGWTKNARTDYLDWLKPQETPGAVKLEQVIGWLSANLPDDAILTNGAGNYAAFLHRYFQFKQYGTALAPTSGCMGYGFPAAIAAALQHPERTVVCLAGDGCFQMTLNEMSTAMQHNAKLVVIVCNNGRYGTIRMHQERHYPARVSGTDLANPNFAALAQAYGGHGEVVTDGKDFPVAFARATAAPGLAVIELKLDPEMLSTGQTVSEVRGTP